MNNQKVFNQFDSSEPALGSYRMGHNKHYVPSVRVQSGFLGAYRTKESSLSASQHKAAFLFMNVIVQEGGDSL